MKTNIYLVYNANVLCVFSDVQSNPFNVGDKINISVNDLTKKSLNFHGENFKETATKKHAEAVEELHLKTVELISVNKYLNLEVISDKENVLNIEYDCNFIEHE